MRNYTCEQKTTRVSTYAYHTYEEMELELDWSCPINAEQQNLYRHPERRRDAKQSKEDHSCSGITSSLRIL